MNSTSDKKLINKIKRDPHLIGDLTDASEAVQLFAVNYTASFLEHIKNPSYAVQLAACKRDGFALRYIENQTEELIQAALESNPGMICRVQNRTRDHINLAISYDPTLVVNHNFDKDIIEDNIKVLVKFLLTRITEDGFLSRAVLDVLKVFEQYNISTSEIEIIRNSMVVEKLKYAVNSMTDDQKIEYLEEHIFDGAALHAPSEKVQRWMVKTLKRRAIDDIINPSEKMKMLAVSHYGKAIQYLRDPSEELQLAAIKNDPSVICDLWNPTEKAQILACRLDPSNITEFKNPCYAAYLTACRYDPLQLYKCHKHLTDSDIAKIKPRAIKAMIFYGMDEAKTYLECFEQAGFDWSSSRIVKKIKAHKIVRKRITYA